MDPSYDQAFIRVGAGPGSREVPALVLFGAGLVSLHALWSRGIVLWLKKSSSGRICIAAGIVLEIFGVFMIMDVHLV